ncbi:MAG: PLP-dependent aminotransferase family protein [Candidatus Krumholzibacteriia bacterium]
MTIWTPDISSRGGPRYRAIAEALADDVGAGRLLAGDRLPTHRELAERLGVTVGTVSRAYAEAERRGLLRGEVGRGTFVTGPGGGRDVPGRTGEPGGDGPIELESNLPLCGQDPDLAGALRELAGRPGCNDLLSYPPAPGSRRHRQAGATWIARHGLEVALEQVVVTAGAQHAITVVLGGLCQPGDTVLAESLTYPGLKTVARLLGLRLVPVVMDEQGMRADALDAVCRRERARVLYCLPTLQNPTTGVMDAERRQALAEVARRHDLALVEDDVHGLLEAGAPPPLATFAPERTHYIASTSKLVAGGLRVAYVAVPPGTADRIASAVAASLWIPPPLTAELAAIWIEDGTADRVSALKCEEAAARQRLAAAILPPDHVHTRERSYFLWLELRNGWRADAFAATARARGVAVAAPGAFWLGEGEPPAAVRVSLSAPRHRWQVEAGLTVLADVLARGPATEPAIV